MMMLPFVKFTTLTSGNDTNEETIATSSPTFTIGLFDAAGSGTVTGKKLYFSLTTNAADADDNTVASPGSDFAALTDVEADWISIDKASNLTAQTATVTLDIIDDATDEENQNVTVTLGIKGADFNGGKAFSSTTVGYNETASDAAQATPDNMVHTYTIKDDDDPPVLKYSQSSSSVNEGATETITIQFDDSGGNTVLSEKVVTVDVIVSTTASDCGSAGDVQLQFC